MWLVATGLDSVALKHVIQCHFIFHPQSQVSRASKGLASYPYRRCLWLNDIKRVLEASSLSTLRFPLIITPNHTYTHLYMHTWTTQVPPSLPSHLCIWMGTVAYLPAKCYQGENFGSSRAERVADVLGVWGTLAGLLKTKGVRGYLPPFQ